MFNVKVLLPNKVVVENFQTEELKIPTAKGQINVLPEHTHVISNLDIGVLQMGSGSGAKKLGIAFGVCKILKDDVTILTQVAEYPENVDKKAAADEIASLTEQLQKTDSQTNEQVQRTRDKLEIAKMKLEIAN